MTHATPRDVPRPPGAGGAVTAGRDPALDVVTGVLLTRAYFRAYPSPTQPGLRPLTRTYGPLTCPVADDPGMTPGSSLGCIQTVLAKLLSGGDWQWRASYEPAKPSGISGTIPT